MKVKKYHISIRIIHWLMAFLVIGMITSGIYMEDLDKDDSIRSLLYSLHKSFGVCVLLLFIVRILLRLITKTPPFPTIFPKAVVFITKAGHAILYVLMLVIPLSGVVMSNAAGYSVNIFGYALPKIVETNKELSHFAGEVHEILPLIMIAVLVAHIFAAFKHKIEGGEKNIMKRII